MVAMVVSVPSYWFLLIWFCLLMVMERSASWNSDEEALTALRRSFSDPDSALASWDPNLGDPCTWRYVTCNSENRVIRVDLGMLNLGGQLVPELGNLEYLQNLEVYKNNIQGSIPPQLGNLKNLISLDLSNNNLSGSIPPELGNLQSLIFLRLNNNKLTGVVPKELSKLHNLKVRDLLPNNFTEPIPPVPPEQIPEKKF